MKWYHFDQNNSGGFFVMNDDVGEHVFIQASDEESAMHKFSLLDNQGDNWCECCGQRWYGCDEQNEPSIYGKPLTEGFSCYTFAGYVVLHYANGDIEKQYTTK